MLPLTQKNALPNLKSSVDQQQYRMFQSTRIVKITCYSFILKNGPTRTQTFVYSFILKHCPAISEAVVVC